MPHVNIKHFPRTFDELERARLAEAITRAVLENFETYEGAVSVAIEAVPEIDWSERVVRLELESRADQVIKAPTYRTN